MVDKITHKHLVHYFKNINEQLKDFPEDSFFRMDLDEIFGGFRSGINFPAMAIESPEGSAGRSKPQNSVAGRTFGFSVFQNPENNNFDQQNEMLDQCERIGLMIMARMRYDNANPKSILYHRFDFATVNWVQVGPLFDEELYGYRFTGEIEGSEPLKIDPSDWKDLDDPCP